MMIIKLLGIILGYFASGLLGASVGYMLWHLYRRFKSKKPDIVTKGK